MRLPVTGGAGFIGSALVRSLPPEADPSAPTAKTAGVRR